MRTGKGTVEGDKGSVSLPLHTQGLGRIGPWEVAVPRSRWCHGGALSREQGCDGWMEPYSPQTFAAGRGPGIERECWRRVTSWAAACLCCLRSVAAGCLSVPPRLSAVGGTAALSPWPCQPCVPGGNVPLPCAWPRLPPGTYGCPSTLVSQGDDGGAMGMLGVGVQMLHSGPCGKTGKC